MFFRNHDNNSIGYLQDLQQYLIVNRHKMASLNESGVPLRLMCDVSSALAHLHSRGHLYGSVHPFISCFDYSLSYLF